MKISTQLVVTLLIININAYAQVGINTENPDPSAVLDIASDDMGILLPRLDILDLETPAPVDNPATGLTVWNTDHSNDGDVNGIYFWDGESWVRLVTTSDKTGFGGSEDSEAWQLQGNNLDRDDFIGSTNYEPIIIKTNSNEVARFDPQSGAISMGFDANANKNRGVAIGSGANVVENDGIAIGTSSQTDFKSVAIGHSSTASGNSSLSVGRDAMATSFKSTAIGPSAISQGQGSTAIGNNATSTQAESIILGDYDDDRATVGIGTLNPTEKLQVNGSIRLVDGNQGEGRVLTSTANGKAYWSDLNSIKSFGQILKNNTSTLNNNTYIDFGATLFDDNITANTNSFQAGNFTGVYRVSYTITMSKWKGGPIGVKFFLSKNNSSSNELSGSEVFVEVDNNDKVTVQGERYVRLKPFESVGVFSDISSPNVKVHAEGTSMRIELFKRE